MTETVTISLVFRAYNVCTSVTTLRASFSSCNYGRLAVERIGGH